MAVEATLKPFVRRIARSLRKYASTQGWGRDDYRLYFETSELWGRIRIVIVARNYLDNDEFERWNSVMKFLRKDTADDPELIHAINLVVWTFDQLKEGGIYRVSPEYEDADDLFPNDIHA